jgi:hypothetical protein
MILVVFSNINSLYLPKRSIRTFDSQACEESLSSFRQVRRSILRASIRDNDCPFFFLKVIPRKTEDSTGTEIDTVSKPYIYVAKTNG